MSLFSGGPKRTLLDLSLGDPPPPPSPSSEAPDEPALVAAGSFRVDRGRALQKLSEHQLEDPRAFLLCWIRCAVASGATWIKMADRTGTGIQVRFDGRPLPAEAVRDPYENLFSGSERDPSRHLAVGLLGAMRLEPCAVRLVSGPPEARVRYEVSLDGRAFPEMTASEAVTEFSVSWPDKWFDPRPGACLEAARRGFGLVKVDLTISGMSVPILPGGWENSQSSEVRGRSARWRLLRWGPGQGRALIHLYHLGALVGSIPWSPPGRCAEALLADHELTLNLSHSGVVRDARLEETLKRLEAAVPAVPVPGNWWLTPTGDTEEGFSPLAWLAVLSPGVLLPAALWIGHRFGTRPLPGTTVFFIDHLYFGYALLLAIAIPAAVLVFGAFRSWRGAVRAPTLPAGLLALCAAGAAAFAFFLARFPFSEPMFSVARLGGGVLDLRGDALPIGRVPIAEITSVRLTRWGKDGNRALVLGTRRGPFESWRAEDCRDLLPLARKIAEAGGPPVEFALDEGGPRPAPREEVCP